MVLDWFGSRNTDVAELIARKKYGKAIEVMRAQFKQRPPGLETRLQFVDVLMLAGRGKEAVPVLIGLADELTADGQAAKAIGLLKRVEELEPARPDVEERLAALVKKEFEAAAEGKWQPAGPAPELKAAGTASKFTVSERVAFDLEEIPDEEGGGTLEPKPEPDSGAAPGSPAAPPSGGDPTVTHQIRGAFRRFLSELPGGETGAATAETAPEPTPDPAPEPQLEPESPAAESTLALRPEPPPEQATQELPASEELRPEATPTLEVSLEPAPTEAEVEPEVEPDVEPEVEPEIEPDAAEANAEPVVEPEEPELMVTADDAMSEQTFQGQVLDLIEEVVQQPLPAAAAPEAPGPDEKPVRTRGVAESAQRLVASPLFRELGEAELLAVVRGMRLHTYEAGDVAITEGEAGESLFVVSSGSVRMFVRNPAGHNFEMGVLQEGDFFGELSSLSGRPRGSTVVATGHTELLELAKKTVDHIARTHPRVLETLESVYIQRASSPEAAAIRAVPVDAGSHQRAIEVLEAYFGESRWDPRMRLRLADLLVKAGKEDDAVPLLVGLADDLDRAGYPEKAIAILKKIEKLRKRGTEEVNLAPLRKKAGPATLNAIASLPEKTKDAARAQAGKRGRTVDSFASWMVDVVRDAVAPSANTEGPLPETLAPGYAKGLLATPLFEGLSEDELLTMIRELRLLSFDPGDIIITEGEPGQSLFILTAGAVKVSVRNAHGRNVKITELRAGSFFGEMATVSGKPRTATVTAGQRCELLELDRPAIDQIAARHPRVWEVLQEMYIARASSPETARARAGAGAT